MSILLAQVFGVYFLVLGVALLINGRYFYHAFQDMVLNTGVMLLSGVLALIIGALLVVVHNVWTTDWRVAITLIGWISLVKGIGLMMFPERMIRFSEWFITAKRLRGNALLQLAFGAFFAYYGFLYMHL